MTKKVTRTKPAPVAVEKAPKSRTLYMLTNVARPVAGKRLFAHTAAALATLGLAVPSRPVVNRAAVVTLMGHRAVSYHLSQKNFEAVGDGIRLTKSGMTTLAERETDKGMVAAFANLFKSGKPSAEIGVTARQIAGVSVAL